MVPHIGMASILKDALIEARFLKKANLRGRPTCAGADLRKANLRGVGRPVRWGQPARGPTLRGGRPARVAEPARGPTRAAGRPVRGRPVRGRDLRGGQPARGPTCAGADLRGGRPVRWAEVAEPRHRSLSPVHPGTEGAFVGWKKCKNNVIVKLSIPADAKRSHGTERKCRASHVEVLEVLLADVGISMHDGKTEYRAGADRYGGQLHMKKPLGYLLKWHPFLSHAQGRVR